MKYLDLKKYIDLVCVAIYNILLTVSIICNFKFDNILEIVMCRLCTVVVIILNR